MTGKEPTREELIARNKALEERILDVEQTLKSIRNGEVDALVISESGEERIYTLMGADTGYRTLVESMNEGALILASDDTIYHCNNCFAAMVQYPINRIIGADLNSFIGEDFQSKLAELLLESRSSGNSKAEFQLKRADGTALPVNLSLNSVDLKQFKGICAVVTDLSTQKKTENELKSYAEQLESLNRELQDFAFIASHDLQEPLRKIQTFANMIGKRSKGKLDEKTWDYVVRVQNSSDRMAQLIRDLLSYSRLGVKCEHSPVELQKAVMEALSDLEIKIENSGGSVDISELPTIRADLGQMRQLFQNLISNALKFTEQKRPRVRIYSRLTDNEWQIYVEDNGIGFDERYLDRIFAPFQRLHGRNEYEGTGMGLAICRKIVERHGGKITAKSQPEKGSTFIVSFPISSKECA